MKRILNLFVLFAAFTANARTDEKVLGRVVDANSGEALIGATVFVEGTDAGVSTDAQGRFTLYVQPTDKYLVATYMGYEQERKEIVRPVRDLELVFELTSKAITTNTVEVFGSRYVAPDKLDFVTRMPLRPSEQIQTISVISDKMISQQGNLTLADATKNVVGVSTFATYGNTSESLSLRGFRGIPMLKNGVRVHSDFRGTGFLSDMQGIETIQVVKGSASVTQGIGDDLGSAGGTVNIATKTPKFINGGEVSLRGGSWGLFRPTFDVQSVLTSRQDLAVRVNGAYERSDNYRKQVNKDRIYFNPSLEWRPDSRSSLILEMDYLHDSRTPDRGTVNLASSDTYALYDLPHNKFLGFSSDRIFTDQMSYSLRYHRKLSEKFTFRAAVVGATLKTDNTGASTGTRALTIDGEQMWNMRQRSLGRSKRNDKNDVVQIDLIGQDVYTGSIKHTFQTGVDFKRNKTASTSFSSVVVDTINVLDVVSNTLPSSVRTLTESGLTEANEYSYGLMAQDVVTFNKYLKAVLGVRYSYSSSTSNSSNEAVTGDAWNPMAGLIISPMKGVNIFGSYTNTTSLRSASNLMEDGTPIGASRNDQFEAGVKTEWLGNRLRVNMTYFHINNKNLAYQTYDEAEQATGRYAKAGNLKREGFEGEISGRPHRNVQVILGYTYLDAQYQNSPAYVNGSAPINTPKHTANGWVYYTFGSTALEGLSLGAGAYYVGSRPVDDYSQVTTHTGTTPGVKPFRLKAYTTVNVSAGYSFSRFGVNLYFNNIFDKLGYSSYFRGGYINPIDPFNVSAVVTYRF